MDLADQIQFMFNKKGEKTFALLPFDLFQEIFEDYMDSKAIEERRREPTISLEQLKQELKTDGKL